MEYRTNSTYKRKVIKKLFRTQLFNNNVNVSAVKVQKNREEQRHRKMIFLKPLR